MELKGNSQFILSSQSVCMCVRLHQWNHHILFESIPTAKMHNNRTFDAYVTQNSQCLLLIVHGPASCCYVFFISIAYGVYIIQLCRLRFLWSSLGHTNTNIRTHRHTRTEDTDINIRKRFIDENFELCSWVVCPLLTKTCSHTHTHTTSTHTHTSIYLDKNNCDWIRAICHCCSVAKKFFLRQYTTQYECDEEYRVHARKDRQKEGEGGGAERKKERDGCGRWTKHCKLYRVKIAFRRISFIRSLWLYGNRLGSCVSTLHYIQPTISIEKFLTIVLSDTPIIRRRWMRIFQQNNVFEIKCSVLSRICMGYGYEICRLCACGTIVRHAEI